jgi:hypothetical protein
LRCHFEPSLLVWYLHKFVVRTVMSLIQMESKSQFRSRRFRYRLRTLFALVAVGAILLAAVRPISYWLDSTPLARSVLRMNDDLPNTAQSNGGPITEEKVLTAIESKLSRGNAPDNIKATLERIANYRRLPSRCTLGTFVYYKGAALGKQPIECHVVELKIPTGSTTSFMLHICEVETRNPNVTNIHEAFE